MTVTKILEATLTAGQTSVIFNDADIPNSLIRIYSNDVSLLYTSATLSGTSLTVTYEAQTSNKNIALELVKAGMDIVDNVTSTDADKALSAKQGKELKDSIDTLTNTVNNLDIPDNITDLDDVNVTSIQDGQVLAWDEDTEKFINVTPSSSGGIIYSTDERLIGSYFDKALYEKSFIVSSTVTMGNNYVIAHDLTNIEKIINIKGNYFDVTDSRAYPLPNLRQTWNESVYIACHIPSTNTPVISLQSGGYNYGSVKNIEITVQYTKIT